MLRDLLQLFFPKVCAGCGESLGKGEDAVCAGCLMELEETRFHLQPTENALYFRLAGKVPLAGAAAYCYFDKRGRFKRMMQALKYGNRPQVGKALGLIFGQMLQAEAPGLTASALVPVPLHRSRLAERGYNQSEMIADGLSRAMQIPVVTDALVRAAKTASQTKKSQAERWENVQHVFEMRKPLSGSVILVDDVITTGATLEACIRTLMAQPAPPSAIYVLSLGMARHD